MHHLTMKTDDTTSVPPPVCPKPRRVGVPLEFLKPSPPLCLKHSDHRSNAGEDRSEVLTMIAAKAQMDEGREWVGGRGGCCSPTCSYYWGSPPTRTDNALVHDVQFLHQMELLSPFMRTKLSDRFGFASASPI